MRRSIAVYLMGLTLLLVACSPSKPELVPPGIETRIEQRTVLTPAVIPPTVPAEQDANAVESQTAATKVVAVQTLDAPTLTPTPKIINRRVEVNDEFKMTQFLLPFDGIRPIYKPEFVTADLSPYQDEELVMGVVLDGKAKAYPVTVLRFREMVNDELAGIPILVTW